MKLVVFAPKPPWFNEGQARVLREHCRRMDLDIYCTDPSSRQCGKKGDITVFKSYFPTYLFCPKLVLLPKKKKILAHGFTIFPPLAAAWKAKELYLMPHYHPLGSTGLFNLFRKIYDPTIGKFLLSKAKKIFCVSDYEKEELIKRFNLNPKKLVTVYNGVDLNRFKGPKPYSVKRPVILYVGRFEKYKNVQHLIKAMPYLPQFDLKIIGSGHYEKKLKNLAQNKKNIEILTNLSNQEVTRWYKSCSVFVTLSSLEAFGLTVVEALAAGKPVIVNDATSLSEFADKFDCVKKINLHQTAPAELAELINKTAKLKMSKIDLSAYDWHNIVKKIKKNLAYEIP